MREILQSSTGGANAGFAENILITLPQREPPEGYNRLVKRFPNYTFNFYALKEWDGLWTLILLKELLRHAAVLLVDWTLPNIEQVPNLKIVQLSCAGFDRVVKQPLYTDTKITFCTTLGILGYGSIGRQVARVANGLGMKIHAYTASPRPTPASKVDRGYILPGTGDQNGKLPDAWFSGIDKSSLHTFLSGVDVLVSSLLLTDSTRHMLSAAEFEILGKRNAYVVNALKVGLLAGASLDVTEPEPLPADSELWDMRNVVITPHIGSTGRGYARRVVDLLEASLGRLSTGESMFNIVQRGRGY
ncbi:unnamed protein product [Tuber aestivum]|uniref:D-isomer specific 2-hydroxyacid dehydrogenase NAD-binding domain-containing protein n=1 Tax=Tuber aestivum TaxID=59557 RepID=A0A292PWG0_9PEZI|nr:unnamed protein product [Tuber aestivum]